MRDAFRAMRFRHAAERSSGHCIAADTRFCAGSDQRHRERASTGERTWPACGVMNDGPAPLRRRTLLASAGAGILASALPPGRARAQPTELLVEPAEIRSQGGVLNATLTAAPGPIQLGEVR